MHLYPPEQPPTPVENTVWVLLRKIRQFLIGTPSPDFFRKKGSLISNLKFFDFSIPHSEFFDFSLPITCKRLYVMIVYRY